MDQDRILRSSGTAKPLPPLLLQPLCAASDACTCNRVLRVFGVHELSVSADPRLLCCSARF